MKIMKRTIPFLAIIAVLMGFTGQKEIIRDDLKTIYEQAKVQGSFVLFDQNKNEWIFCNRTQLNQPFIPASTFKIYNSLVGLETGVIKDENFVIPWDSVIRQNSKWNADHDLKTAFKNSTVWYYQELAERVGGQRMKYWLDKVPYGNCDTTGGISRFWLTGGLRITPAEQIDLLRKLRNNQLPFSQRSMDIVKKIMIAKDTLDYVVRAKTGWGDEKDRIIGWYVGYVEKKGNVYYFANCMQSSDLSNKTFGKERIDITYKMLKGLKILE